MSALVPALAGLVAGVTLLRTGLAWGFPKPQDTPDLAPGALTVLTAVLGGDPALRSRLEGTRAALPDQAFVYLLDADDAEGHRDVAAAVAAEPGPHTRVVTCLPCPPGLNPKVWKLARAEVRTPFLAVVDDDTLLPRASAAALVAAAGPGNVATGVPCYEPGERLPSALLAQFVDNHALATYLGTARLVPPPSLNGMGYVLSRETLEGLGGFEPILDCLTDDLALALHLKARGGEIRQVAVPFFLRTEVRDLDHLCAMLHRWFVFALLLVREVPTRVALLVGGLHGLPPFLLLGLVVLACLQPSLMAWGCLAACLVLRSLCLGALHRRFYERSCHRPLPSLLSELTQPLHLLHAGLFRHIQWRGRRYRVRGVRDFQGA